MHSRMEGLVLVPRRTLRSLKQKSAQQVDTVETRGRNTAKNIPKPSIMRSLMTNNRPGHLFGVWGLANFLSHAFFLGTKKNQQKL